VTTSFFITNFPPDVTSEELWKLFLKFGRVVEVYIPKKLDKMGKRFGFVKFKEVREEEALGEKLRDVWMGSFKLWVNRSRFGRSYSRDAQASKATTQQKEVQVEVTPNGKSFKDVLLRGGISSEAPAMHVPVNEAFCKELQDIMVGLLKGENEVRHIQTTLFMEGFQSIKVTSMGDI
jgi:RNA recognition motif-containing protein